MALIAALNGQCRYFSQAKHAIANQAVINMQMHQKCPNNLPENNVDTDTHFQKVFESNVDAKPLFHAIAAVECLHPLPFPGAENARTESVG
ncbi:hypothetical protein MJ923_10200 [Shewanella sp. 3B26]|uniref:Uncharacterized protein n=1 Tax=Shewanella zhuhaiensis TaxID=2919576 RepID=A0AAJ1BH57_9GAMM|nr:hypothetical protein [Shewanella zhuhaiensis]MCH4294670.1 hypothetical protein [Shewanella zhuhaiensis]